MRLISLGLLCVMVPGCVVVVDGEGTKRRPPSDRPILEPTQPTQPTQTVIVWEETRTVIVREYFECDTTYVGAVEYYHDEYYYSDEDLIVLLFIARLARADFHEVCASFERNRYDLWTVARAYRLTGDEFFIEIDRSTRCSGIYERPYASWFRRDRVVLSNEECHALVSLHIGIHYYGFTAVEWFQKTERSGCREVLVSEGSRCGKGRTTYRAGVVVEVVKPWSDANERERCERDRRESKETCRRDVEQRVRIGEPTPTKRRNDDAAQREAERRKREADEAAKRREDENRRRMEAREGEAKTRWAAAVGCYDRKEWHAARIAFDELIEKYGDTSYLKDLARNGTTRAGSARVYIAECDKSLARDDAEGEAKRRRDEEARKREEQRARDEAEARRREDEKRRREIEEARRRDEEARKREDDHHKKCRDGVARGEEKQRKGDYDGAIEEFSVVIKLDATIAIAWATRGACRHTKGDLDGAITDCTKAIEIDATLYIAFSWRAAAHKGKGDLDGCIADYRRALELAPGDWKEKKAVDKACKDAEADRDRRDKAMNDAERRKAEEARAKRDVEEAKRRADEEARRKAEADRKKKDLEEARRKADEEARKREADEAKRRADEDRKRADEEAKRKADEAKRNADEEAKRKADEDRKKRDAQDHDKKCKEGVARGQDKEERGDFDGAIAEYTAVLKLDAQIAIAWGGRGWCRAQRGDFDGAIADCDAALKIEATLTVAFAGRGAARCGKGDLDGGIADFQVALKNAPGSWKLKKSVEKACRDAEAKKGDKKDDEAKRKADEAKRRADEEAKRKDDEDRRKRDEEAKQKADAEAKRKAADEAKRKADEEAKRKADDEAKRKAADEAKRKADEEAKRKADDEAKRKAADEAKRKADEEAKRKADDEAKRKAADEAKRKADEEAKRKADEEAKRKPSKEEQETKSRGLMDRLAGGLEAYRAYHQGRGQAQLPDGDNAAMVRALTTKPVNLKDPFIKFDEKEVDKDGRLVDAWGNPFVYRNQLKNWPKNKDDKSAHNKQGADIYSCGANGKDENGEGDDVANWKK